MSEDRSRTAAVIAHGDDINAATQGSEKMSTMDRASTPFRLDMGFGAAL
ncbi:hypothetical protein BH20CHL7_BH20CHL7_19490 [soil metagenome]